MKKLKILVMGLPGSGKTTFAKALISKFEAVWLNADKIRSEANDWDFSLEGRNRQAARMKNLANETIIKGNHVVADFVCPTNKTREDFNADYTVWLDTIKKGRFDDTNKMFDPPTKFEFRVPSKNAEQWAQEVANDLKDNFLKKIN